MGEPFGKGHHLSLVDGSAFIFRAYHALPPLTRKSDGMPVGAVSGFCNMLWKMIQDAKGPDAPTHAAVVFDKGSVTFRNEIFDQYKANRDAMPEDLSPQIPLTREATRAFNIACLEQEGFEADDIIASLACKARDAGGRVTIVSSDKDLMQLVGDGVEMLDPMKNVRIDAEGVREKFGVGPERVVDVQALAGDPTDNVPGAPGIGLKTAALLDQRVRRSGDAAAAGGGDQAAEAAADADRVRRPDPGVEAAGGARLRDGPRLRALQPGGEGAGGGGAAGVPAGDGVPLHRQAGLGGAGGRARR